MNMLQEFRNALAACVVTLLLCSVTYPAVLWGMGRWLFPYQAGGSLIVRNGQVVGSELIAQPFVSDQYFHPRPSAVDYKADAAGGSNLGTKNPKLRDQLALRATAAGATKLNPAPTDLVTASGSGLDPDISPQAARYQADRVSRARHMPIDQVIAMIDKCTSTSGLIIGASPRVNVLRLNLALDDVSPSPTANITRPHEARTEFAADSSTRNTGQ